MESATQPCVTAPVQYESIPHLPIAGSAAIAGGPAFADISPLAELQVSSTLYDADGRPETLIHAPDNRTTIVYNANGQVSETINALGGRTTNLYDSKGRVQEVIDFTVGATKPDLTLMLHVPLAVSEQRRKNRPCVRDRFEEADRAFFERVEQGFRELAKADSVRIRWIDASQPIDAASTDIWKACGELRLFI